MVHGACLVSLEGVAQVDLRGINDEGRVGGYNSFHLIFPKGMGGGGDCIIIPQWGSLYSYSEF